MFVADHPTIGEVYPGGFTGPGIESQYGFSSQRIAGPHGVDAVAIVGDVEGVAQRVALGRYIAQDIALVRNNCGVEALGITGAQ